MLVVTTNDVPGARVRSALGQVFGVVVRSRGIGGNIMAGLRSIVGGEIHEYTQMLEEARRHALDRLVSNAALMGADAVVAMRFDSSEIGRDHERDRRLRHGRDAGASGRGCGCGCGCASASASAASAASGFGHRSRAP